MKTLTLNVYKIHGLKVANFHEVPGREPGVYFLDEGGAYIKPLSTNMGTMYIGPLDLATLPFKEYVEPAATSVQGISEDALLAALAIAQDPKLAPQLLALRQTPK